MSALEALAEALGEPVEVRGGVAGGDINIASRARTASGREIFVKTNASAPPDMFPAEAEGLRLLGSAEGGCRVPEVLAVGPGFLALEWLAPQRPRRTWGEELGRGLAAIHRVTHPTYGLDGRDNYIGATPQPNPPGDDWVTYFADVRLGFQQELLGRRGRLGRELDRGLDRLRARLGEWLRTGDERPALLHGDLWSGNAISGSEGEAVIIDPAVYFGGREADLAMTELFGRFPASFYEAYDEAFPLEPGYAERRDLYNLYHVLNHANLFGGGYAAQAARIVARYVGH